MNELVYLGAPADSVGRGRGPERGRTEHLGAGQRGEARGGAELAPAVLRELGLPDAIGASDGGDLPVRIRGDERDPSTGLLGSAEVLASTGMIRDAARGTFAGGAHRVFLAGGCCATFVGALAGARDAFGRIGLAYVDGHQDLWDGATSPSGEAADMPLATALGRGPSAWVESAGGPSVASEDLVLLGDRDAHEFAELGLASPVDELEPDVLHVPADEVRASGPAAIGAAAAGRFDDGDPGRFWLHLDVDVLDAAAFPATDYPSPGGLTWAELGSLLGPLASSAALVGVSIGCYNPDKDPGRASGARLVRLWKEALG